MKAEMAQLQQSAVHNHTAAMLEMGTNLLSQTAEQTRKLTDVETQVRTLRCVVGFLLFLCSFGSPLRLARFYKCTVDLSARWVTDTEIKTQLCHNQSALHEWAASP